MLSSISIHLIINLFNMTSNTFEQDLYILSSSIPISLCEEKHLYFNLPFSGYSPHQQKHSYFEQSISVFFILISL